jgi:pimeloyl-ACP methyl ester carboxylesterase
MKQPDSRKTFVLVPGAGHGGWVWRSVVERLTRQGHRVFAPSLTGLGDRSHLLGPNVTLETHINDIVHLFHWEDITDATLVGHSYGGWVISGAIEQLEDRVTDIVFVDAFLPNDGERGIDLVTDVQRASILDAVARGDTSRPGPTSAALKVQDADAARWVDAKITPQPIGVSLHPLRLTGARERVRAKLYIRTPLFPSARFDAALATCAQDSSWRTAIMDNCGHDPMVDQPDALCELLEGVA